MYHKPALAEETISMLAIREGGVYVDLTFGGGGHSKAILECLGNGRLIAFDQDPDAKNNLPEDERVTFVDANFRYLRNFLKYHNAYPVDGILADLGVSSHQFDVASRGFSTRFDGPLDMRMDPSHGLTAEDIIQSTDIKELARIFQDYGEIKNARKLAEAIMNSREAQTISTTSMLKEIVEPLAPIGRENQYLAKVFQALRIAVNREMEALEEMLLQLPGTLKAGGRVAIITYHSLEDRMVKYFFRSGRLDGKIEKDFFGKEISPFQLVTRKAMQPSDEEIKENPRVRSAKLRVVERIELKEDE